MSKIGKERKGKSEKNDTLIIVDCENTSNQVVKVLMSIKEVDKYLILGVTQHMEQYELDRGLTDTYSKSNIVGKNASDDVLIFELGRLIGTRGYKNIAIVSRDKGFDRISKYIRSLDINIQTLKMWGNKNECAADKALEILNGTNSGMALLHLEDRLEETYGKQQTYATIDALSISKIITIGFSRVYQVYYTKSIVQGLIRDNKEAKVIR